MEAYLDACGLSLQAQANTDLDEPQSLKLQHRNLLLWLIKDESLIIVQALMPCFPYKAAWEREREMQEIKIKIFLGKN